MRWKETRCTDKNLSLDSLRGRINNELTMQKATKSKCTPRKIWKWAVGINKRRRRVNIARRSLDAAPPAWDAKKRLRSGRNENATSAPGRNCTHECAFLAAPPSEMWFWAGAAGGGRKRRKPKAAAGVGQQIALIIAKSASAFSRRKKEAPENRLVLLLVIGAFDAHTHAVAFESERASAGPEVPLD